SASRTRIDERAEGIDPAGDARTCDRDGHIGYRRLVPGPEGLDIGHDAEPGEARNIIGINALHMCQLMQAWPSAIHVTRGFQPIERRPHSLVADHMAMDLEARRIEGNEELAQMVLAEHHRRIAALSVMIILEHRGGA